MPRVGIGENHALDDFRCLVDSLAFRIQPEHWREHDPLAPGRGPRGFGIQPGEWPPTRNLALRSSRSVGQPRNSLEQGCRDSLPAGRSREQEGRLRLRRRGSA